MKEGVVYILSNKARTTLYIGVTNDLERRMLEHKAGIGSTFTTKYKLTDLLYFEQIEGMQDAIDREKQLKNWLRQWKWDLIQKGNPCLLDLSIDWQTKEEIKTFKKMMKSVYKELNRDSGSGPE